MRSRLAMVWTMILISALAACAPAATPAAPPAQPTSMPAPAATLEPTVPPVAIKPPSSGGPAAVPTPSPTPTLAAGRTSITASRSAWARIDATNPPPARYDHTLVLDTASNKLVVFGGRDGSNTLGDTWIYDPTAQAWHTVKSTPAPEARFGHAAAYDLKSKRVLIFGGQASGFFNDVWAFDAAKETWQKVDAKGSPPAARYGTSAIVDTRANTLIITHGFSNSRFDDTFALDLATNTWSAIKSIDNVPLKRCLHESVYDAKSKRMILFGGCSSGFGPCPQGDLWSLDVAGKDWNEISPSGIKPSPRSNPSLVGDDAGRLILFGGKTADGPSADTWSLDIASGEWAALMPAGDAPAARYSHDAVWNPATKQVIIFGGRGSAGALNDLWAMTP